MDHITIITSTATPDQIARALVLAENFAAHSGIQAHSGAKDHTLALYNIILTDRLPPLPESAKRPATTAGTTPTYSVPTDAEGHTHPNDVGLLIAWLQRWPADVKTVEVHVPRTGETITLGREGLLAALLKDYA